VSAVLALLRDKRGGSATEFALLLPLFLLFLLGIIDAGRYAWEYNQAEKATQIGARWAVATDMLPGALKDYSFAISCAVPQGTPVGPSEFGGATCQSDASTATCTVTSSCSSPPASTADNMAFGRLANRMGDIYPAIQRPNIVVDYANSGLGFSGDPNGPDVAPLVTVSLRDLTFQPMTLMLFNGTLSIPASSYTLTMEDGQGTDSN
jgi:hypothetical protein